MPVRNSLINFWYIVILLSLISIVLWFFAEYKTKSYVLELPQSTINAAQPIPTSFNKTAIENLNTRVAIRDIDLGQVKPYAGYNAVKSDTMNNARMSTSSGVLSDQTKFLSPENGDQMFIEASRSSQPAL